MPLASTVKIILAIEYARQAAAGEIDADEVVPIAELEKFHVDNTDGGAHESWLASFSSNANAEWLLDKLGSEKVEAELK
eukprot:gene7163-9124_t